MWGHYTVTLAAAAVVDSLASRITTVLQRTEYRFGVDAKANCRRST